MIPSPFGVINVDGATPGASYGAPSIGLLMTKPARDFWVTGINVGLAVAGSVVGCGVAFGWEAAVAPIAVSDRVGVGGKL